MVFNDPQYLVDIFLLSTPELQAKYRQKKDPSKPRVKDERSHESLKKQYKHLLQKAIEMESSPHNPENPELEQLDKVRELLERHGVDPASVKISHVSLWNAQQNNGDGSEVVDMAAVRFTPKSSPEELAELFPPAVAANITPSKRKPVQRDHKLLLFFSDAQMDFRRIIDGRTGEQELVPTHDPRAIRAAQLVAADLQPDLIINCGDTADYSSISRWPANSDHFFKTMGITHQAIHDMYAQFRADNPDARIIEIDSNHNERLKKYVLKNFPQAYDLYRPGDNSDYPVLSYPYLTNLGALGVEWISGGQEAEFIYGEDYTEVIKGREYPKPVLTARHGIETGQFGQAVQKVAKNHPETHNIHGHAHTEQYFTKVNRLGQRLLNIVMPALCKTTGEVDSFHSQVSDRNRVNGVQENWPQGVLLIRDYEGEYVPEFVPIRDGKAIGREKEYDGNE